MNFHLSFLNERIRNSYKKLNIGIIICKAKQRNIVEITLKDINKPMGVATYTLTPTLSKELSKFIQPVNNSSNE